MTIFNPGIYNLGDLTITTPDTQETDWTEDLDGMSAVTIQARFVYGSGGTDVLVFVQTSLDGGTTPIDIAGFGFSTSSVANVVTLSGDGDGMILEPTDGVLAAGYINSGILGDRLRIKVISTGTYSGSTLVSVRAAVR